MADGLGPRLETPLVGRLSVIGIGLIGGSILRAVQRKGIATQTIAYDGAASVRERARVLGIADVVADKIYTSAEFKKVKETFMVRNFVQCYTVKMIMQQ